MPHLQLTRPIMMQNTPLTLHRSPVATAVHNQWARAPRADWSRRRGKHTKPIEAIQLGDLVWAWDEQRGESVRRPVVRLFRHQGKPIVAVTVVGDDGAVQRIECTIEHPFWVEDRGWVPACELQAGDVLKRIGAGACLRVASARLTGADADVYNFEVSEVHNYFVGTAGVLVHNDSGKPNPASLWARGARATPEEALRVHFEKHGPEVGARTPDEYTDRARALYDYLKSDEAPGVNAKVLKGARAGTAGDSKRHMPIGADPVYGNIYVDLDQAGKLVSFGSVVKDQPVRAPWTKTEPSPGQGRGAGSIGAISSDFFDPHNTWASGASMDPMARHMARLDALGSGVVANADNSLGARFDVVQVDHQAGQVNGVMGESDILLGKRTVVSGNRATWRDVMVGSKRLDNYASRSRNVILYGHGDPYSFGGALGNDAVSLIVGEGLTAGGGGKGLEVVSCYGALGPIARAVAATGQFTHVVSYRARMTSLNGSPEAVVSVPSVLSTNVLKENGAPVAVLPGRWAKRVTLPVLQANGSVGPVPHLQSSGPLRSMQGPTAWELILESGM